jgi:glycosyltransferase involved in cell wall biosynthesis
VPGHPIPDHFDMTAELGVLSLYEGFFSGGARILHTDVVAGLHGRGQRHRVLSIDAEVFREATRQRMHEDVCHRKLVDAGVPVTALRESAGPASFSDAEIGAYLGVAADAHVLLTLKEQPLRLVNQAGSSGVPVITCLHRSDPENQALDELRAAVRAGRIGALVCCAESARDAYRAAGIPAGLFEVIPNGVDLRRFRPDRRARLEVRAALRIPDDAPVVTLAARYDAMKNVPLFLAAARIFLATTPDAHVVMCGAGMTSANPELAWLSASNRLHLLGVRDDPPAVFAASDVVTLTSAFGEAAPLCLIEGLLCGAVPVSTDVGDCASIVAGCGLLTEPDPEAVAAAWTEAFVRREEFAPALRAARPRFGRRRMIAAYASLIRRLGRTWSPLNSPEAAA